MEDDELHDWICALLVASGGVPGDSVVDNGLNADVVFKNHKVVVEVKTLLGDRALNEAHQAFALKQIGDWRRLNGLDPDNFDVMANDLPPDVWIRIADDWAKPFKSHLEKANKQIRSTNEYLDDRYAGLLIVGLPNNYLANEGSIITSLRRHLDRYRSVDMVYCVSIPSDGRPATAVCRAERQAGRIPDQLLSDFDVEWVSWLEQQFGGRRNRLVADNGAFARDFQLRSIDPVTGKWAI